MQTLEEFQPKHLEDAAALLSLRWQTERKHTPELPRALEDPKNTQELLKNVLLNGASGIVAISGGQLVGYILGARLTPSPASLDMAFYRPRSIFIKYPWHAVAPGCSEVYREMYLALSRQWVSEGFFAHYVLIPASDKTSREVWGYMGFGIDMARGLRDTFPPPAPLPRTRDIRKATPADATILMGLLEGLGRFHAASPIYMPFLQEAHLSQQARVDALLHDPRCICFLAFDGDLPLGLQVYQPPSEGIIAPEDTISLHQAYTVETGRGEGIGTSLLTRGLIWAIEKAYRTCAVSWVTANFAAHRFWLKRGFKPYRYRFSRMIDERIAWAR